MKPIYRIIVALWAGVFGAPFCQSAEQFQNLAFEEPILPLVPNDPLGYGRVPISQALPGWLAYLDDTPLDLIAYNSLALSSANISLFGPPPPTLPVPGAIMEGRYTAFLQSGADLIHPQETHSASLAQVGLVPPQAASVQMKIDYYLPSSVFSVFLGGQEIEMVALQEGPSYTLYGGDASRFAGQVAELRITADLYFDPNSGAFSSFSLDSIAFSSQVVPEPATWALLGLGGMMVAWFGHRAHGKRVGRHNNKGWQEDLTARK